MAGSSCARGFVPLRCVSLSQGTANCIKHNKVAALLCMYTTIRPVDSHLLPGDINTRLQENCAIMSARRASYLQQEQDADADLGDYNLDPIVHFNTLHASNQTLALSGNGHYRFASMPPNNRREQNWNSISICERILHANRRR